MKIQPRQIEQFVQSPDKAARVILVYGPDTGLVSERCDRIGKTVVDNLQDPFNVALLSVETLIEDPAKLSDETNAISMTGAERLIRIDGGNDKITTLIKSYLEKPSQYALVLIRAGELGPRSSLRKLCENANNAAALACYIESEQDISHFIRNIMQLENINIDNDAVIWLATNISGDHYKVRSELEKLIIYKGEEKSSISIEDAKIVCGAAGVQGFDDLVYNVACGNSCAALKAFDTLIGEGVAFIAMLRALQNHFRRLHIGKSYMIDGMSIDAAMKKLTPPVFFKQAPMFKAQLNIWSLPALNTVLEKLTKLEIQCKRTGIPAETLCSQAILAISKTSTK